MTNGDSSGTSGSAAGPPGAERILQRRRRGAYAISAAILVLIAAINALTVAHDTAEAGRMLHWWEPWLWELSSTAYWVAMLPVFGWLAQQLRPPRLSWPLAIAGHGLMTVPVSVAHVATLFALRNFVYWLAGMSYDYGLDAPHLLYEYRKDVLAYAVLVGATGTLEHWARTVGAEAEARPAANADLAFRLEVRDGSRTHWLAPEEIDWVEAAGNYVELQTLRGPVLHRATLAHVGDVLAAHGFVRIHRSRLVRRAAVRSIESTPAGDFELVLADGTRIAGSRRFRTLV